MTIDNKLSRNNFKIRKLVKKIVELHVSYQ